MKKTETREDMLAAGATPEEADGAMELFELLHPALRIKSNGRVDTSAGDKTLLGLYRTVARVYQTETTKGEQP